jgi:hypothetical protein
VEAAVSLTAVSLLHGTDWKGAARSLSHARCSRAANPGPGFAGAKRRAAAYADGWLNDRGDRFCVSSRPRARTSPRSLSFDPIVSQEVASTTRPGETVVLVAKQSSHARVSDGERDPYRAGGCSDTIGASALTRCAACGRPVPRWPRKRMGRVDTSSASPGRAALPMPRRGATGRRFPACCRVQPVKQQPGERALGAAAFWLTGFVVKRLRCRGRGECGRRRRCVVRLCSGRLRVRASTPPGREASR